MENNPKLIALDSSAADFCKDLSILDNLSSRTCDTVHIFYVRSQQTHAEDIVGNILNNSNSLSPYFYEFIHSLGWPVRIDKHPGWTGHISTSWKVKQGSEAEEKNDNCLYDGNTHVLYWADACSEIAFVIPSQIKLQEKANSSESFNTSSLSCNKNFYFLLI